MARNNGVLDLARWQPPTRNRRRGDGSVVVERLNPGASRKMVDRDGNVVNVSTSNGIANRDPADPYGVRITAEKIHGNPRSRKGTPGGFLPFGKCPQAIEGVEEFLPRSIRGRAPCVRAADGDKIGDEHPCSCITEVIAHRQRINAEKCAAEEKRLEPQILQAQRAQAEQTTSVLETLAKVAADLAAAGKKRRE